MIKNILDELVSDNSRKFKESIFEREKNNKLFKRVCELTYDSFINFYLVNFNVPESVSDSISLQDGLDFLVNTLSTRKLTGHAAHNALSDTLSNMHPDDVFVMERVIKRDLKVGASVKTVNKTWPGLVKEFPIMLAQPDKPKNREKIHFPAYAQLKSDGMRCIIVVEGDTVAYFSRNGKLMDVNNDVLDKELKEICDTSYQVLDGELLYAGEDGKYLPRKTGNGLIGKSLKGTISPDEKERIRVVLWDTIDLDYHKSGEVFTIPYNKRLISLNNAVNDSITRVSCSQTRVINNWEEAQEFFKEVSNLGEEGLIIKNIDSPWENKRSENSVKMKSELVGEFKVIEIMFGTGKYEGLIGSLVCVSGGDNPVVFSTGSGMTDYDRSLPPEYYYDKIVSVKYNEIITSKEKNSFFPEKRSLFLPIFQEVRLDKEDPDIL